MIHSMTGYAAQTRDIGRGILHIELRTVNSRYLDINFRVGEDMRVAEPQLRELFASRLNRGKVECRLNLLASPTAAHELAVNRPMLAQLRTAQDAVRQELPDAKPMSVAEVLRWPGVLADEGMEADFLVTEIIALATSAVGDLVATRRREGEKLAAMILDRVTRMRTLVDQAGPKLNSALTEYQERLATRLREAMATLDEERIRQEVGLFAARIDVAEELSRLGAHLDEVSRVVGQGGAVGKRLDFLMQELNREANTLASKSVSSEITGIAVELKLLIEQMREQVQNIE